MTQPGMTAKSRGCDGAQEHHSYTENDNDFSLHAHHVCACCLQVPAHVGAS